MPKSIYPNGLLVSAVALISLQFSSQSFADCKLFEHPNQEGFVAQIADNQNSHFLGDFMIQTRSWAGTWSGWSGTEISFNDAASSAEVAGSCVLHVWEAIDYGGREDTYSPGKHSLKVHDQASSAKCDCSPESVIMLVQ